jgi:hypothetical protein
MEEGKPARDITDSDLTSLNAGLEMHLIQM